MSPAVNIRKPDVGFRLFLFGLGAAVLFLIFLIKSKTLAGELQTDPLLFMYTVFITTFELSRLVGAMLYAGSISKIMKKEEGVYEPSVSFVIPCKNEEGAIEKTISKCFAADYPENKIEVIVINDGSTDRTLSILKRLKTTKFPKLAIVDWRVNRGKRHAMAEGFRRATGEVVIQLDSDSYVKPEDVRNFIQPFRDPNIGAVCAHADPENAEQNLLTRMQAAYYFMSFRILKAAESTFLTVFCCSGCSSAYRRSIVIPILTQWLKEKFLGLPVTWGDDRSLTNRVIKLGYRTIYTDQAQAYTLCPDNLRKFLKQQVRWKKGWFVNSLFASAFLLRTEPFVALTYFFPLIVLTLLTPLMATKALVINPIFFGIWPTFYILGVLLIASLITIYYRYVARENKYWPYVFVWSGINMALLSFILFYALARLKDRKWGTR